VEASFVLDDNVISQSAPSEFQLQQMTDILRARLVARKIDARCLEFGDIETNLAGARQKVTVKQGIERELAKKLQAAMKDAKPRWIRRSTATSSASAARSATTAGPPWLLRAQELGCRR
jgi:uncharacterized protein YajQ (UPF0234 family)